MLRTIQKTIKKTIYGTIDISRLTSKLFGLSGVLTCNGTLYCLELIPCGE